MTKVVFSLYRNPVVKFLRLNRNRLIKSYVEHNREDSYSKFLLPTSNTLYPVSFSFFDIIPQEDVDRFKQKFTSFINSLDNTFASIRPETIAKTFEDYERSYRTTAYGHFYTNCRVKHSSTDLIESIDFNYVKGPHGSFILEYKVYPSQKFIETYKNLLTQKTEFSYEIGFNSFKKIVKGKSIAYTIKTQHIKPSKKVKRLLQDLNFQVQSKYGKKFGVGLFLKNKKSLYPCITTLEANNTEFKKLKREYHSILGLYEWDSFECCKGEVVFNLPNVKLSDKSFENLTMFFLKDPSSVVNQEEQDVFASTAFLSESYIQNISPVWTTLNFTSVYQTLVNFQREQVYKYFNQNSDSIFLKKAIRLKYQITLNWLLISRINSEFEDDIFRDMLNDHKNIPQSTNRIQNIEREFSKVLWHTKHSAAELMINEYEDLKNLFKQISEDNITRSNMSIQKILMWIAFLGVIIAIYSSNKDYVNTWIEFYLKLNFDIEIPKLR